MQAALHVRTKILPGNKIEVMAPELAIGAEVEVFVVAQQPVSAEQKTALTLLEALAGDRLFPTSNAVDAYLQEEREAWDR